MSLLSEYLTDMEKDVKGDTSGCFRKLLVAQMACTRSESPTFDLTAAKKDAQALLQAGEKKWGTDESMQVHLSTYFKWNFIWLHFRF